MPGTATTSSPRTTSGQASRSERGTLASTKTSCTFFGARRAGRLRASRAHGGRAPRLVIVQGPQRTGRRARRDLARARRGRTHARPELRPPRSTRFDPSREASSCDRASLDASRQSAARLAAASTFCSAAGCSRRRSGTISSRMQPARRVRIGRVLAEREPLGAAVRLSLVAPETEQRADDAVRAPRLDPRRARPLATSRKSTVSTWSEAVCPVARSPSARSGGSGRRAAPPRSQSPGGAVDAPRRRARRGRSAASASDSAPRSPCATWTARDPVAEPRRARARGRSSRRRRRRGR